MKRVILCLLLVILGAVYLGAQAPENKAPATKPVAALAWLVGGVWTANASGLSPGMLRIETRYQWADNNAFVRFNTHFVFDKGTAKTYDGHFYWDPGRKTLAMWYMNAENEITEGPVELHGELIKLTFRGTNFEGKLADLRVMLSRKNADDYHWELQEKQGDNWKELAGLEFLRTAEK
ncbi:MAG: hypothetical protein PVS2B2_04910 [Candidatus Acidiferrum sp.]